MSQGLITIWSRYFALTMLCAVLALPGVVASAAATRSQPALTDLQGNPLALQDYRGRVVLLNFWATWCTPCRVEMPELSQLSRQLDSQRAVVIGVAADDRAAVQAFVRKSPVDYRVAVGDPDAVFAWSESLGNVTVGLPFSVLLDAKSVVRWRNSGGTLDPKEVTRLVQRLLAGQSI
jgi:thiol-disulfide isomerase/thioredoxin